ncbi:hypothetical protein BX600DRAFT_389633 [Xylariales sp. PMI_506]|nr:hypothetical protein BX600DRAFT_389633 [Xylariales sp. PMI_506]
MTVGWATHPRREGDLLRSRQDGHPGAEWIDRAQQLARAGYFQAFMIALILTWTIARVVVRGSSRSSSHSTLDKTAARVPAVYEAAGQATRAAAAALIAIGAVQVNRLDLWFNVAIVFYAFVLGLVRLACDTRWQRVILHQVNVLLVASFVILVVSELLPQLKAGSDFTTNRVITSAIASVAAANLVALATPRAWSPPPLELIDPSAPEPKPSLEETASWFTRFLTYEWMTPLVWTGYRRTLAMEDLPNIPWYDEPLKLLNDILNARKKSKQKTLWTVLRYQGKGITAIAIWTGLAAAMELVSPFAMYQLLAYIGDPEGAVLDPNIWLVLMFAGPMAQSVCFQQSIFHATRMDLRIRSGLTQELYNRAISSMELEQDVLNSIIPDGGKKGSAANPKSTSTGRLANLMASDVDAIYRARSALLASVSIPVGVILSAIGLYNLTGWASLVGIGFIIITVPVPAYIAQRMGKYQRRVKVAQDARISLISEYLSSIRAIKYFAWEDPMIKNIQEARLKELKDLWSITVLTTVMATFTGLIPTISLVIIFSLYVGVFQQALTAQVAFPTVFLITTLRNQINKLSWATGDAISAWVSIGRLDRYFASTVPLTRYPAGPLSIKNATFRRNKSTEFLLENIDVDFVEGGLNLITGESGTGKTTLLLSILGETILENGSVTRPDDVAFASQTPWLQGDTLRENILFNSPYDELRYNRVVEACCLDVDLKELSKGDETEVGENGTALSGGQRARVALARALYSKAPLLLLDDTFSALDSKTSASVWKHCFCSDLLQGRTTILVSHIPWMITQADLAITMVRGSIAHIERNIGVTRKPVALEEEETPSSDSAAKKDAVAVVKSTDHAKVDVVSSEMKASGGSQRVTFFKYMLYFGGPGFALFTIFTVILGNAVVLGTTLWLSFWVDAYDSQARVDIAFYLGIYTAFVIGSMMAQAGSYLTFKYGTLVASRRMHERCINSVVNVSLSWWKDVPVGRVVNRLSADVGSIDRTLPSMLQYFLDIFVSLFFRIGAISSIMPIFVVPALVACFIGVVASDMYIRTAVLLRRLSASCRSPVFTQFSDSMSGLAVIRARGNMSRTFQHKLAERYRAYSRAFEAHVNSNRWVAMRIDFVTALVSLSAGIIALSKSSSLAVGLVGFSLSNAAGLSSNILNLVKAFNETEVEMQSFHRLAEYASIEPEEKTDIAHQDEVGSYADQEEHAILQEWPRAGSVEFRNVTIRYDAEGPDILKDVNLTFQAGERVAIVGRTGAGKSTLVLALLRLTHIVSGKILYDGVDITAVSRKKLRKSLTVIPQEAVLFNGTIESNLDPFNEMPRDQLQAVLDSCVDISSLQLDNQSARSNGKDVASGVSHSISDVPEPTEETPLLQSQGGSNGSSSDGIPAAKSISRLSLDTQVLAKGENFSHGQRQVLSLCRALVRKSKLMLLDEATANMDYDTDRTIQDIIRADLKSSGNANRTLVTIAHRLRTIIDYDKVVVVAAGRVVEVGSPRELYLAQGAFHGMVKHSGEGDDLEKLIIGK